MYKTPTPIKLSSHKHPHSYLTKPTNYTHPNRTIELQLQLKQAHTQIQFLKQSNKDLMQKLLIYQRNCQTMKLMQQQLQFRKQQQKSMQIHLDNYQQINNKLRQRITELQNYPKNKLIIAQIQSRTTHSESNDNCQKSRERTKKIYLNQSKLDQNRKNISNTPDNQKQNHPLTPKSRVNINFQNLITKEIQSMHLIKQRRKVFM